MELTYDLKLTDLINFYTHMAKQSVSNRRRMRDKKIKLFFITLCMSLLMQWLYVKPVSPTYYAFSILIALLPVFFYSFYTEKSTKRKFKKFHKNSREPNLFGTYQLSMSNDGLKEIVDDGQEELYEWRNIQKIVTLKNYIYIYTNDIHAVIIPLRVFNSTEDYLLFLNELKRYLKISTKQMIEVNQH